MYIIESLVLDIEMFQTCIIHNHSTIYIIFIGNMYTDV
jgi:hypothetical protein